jgi:hypothetical protein
MPCSSGVDVRQPSVGQYMLFFGVAEPEQPDTITLSMKSSARNFVDLSANLFKDVLSKEVPGG